jgi:type IV secretory pathway protease TraF
MVVKGGHPGDIEAWKLTLQSGNEVVLLIPQKTANELADQHGYVGRIRPMSDEDNVNIAPSQLASKARRREVTKGGVIQ